MKIVDFLVKKVGIEKAELYNKVSHDMINQSENFNGKILNISDPYEKADVYSKIDYSGILNYLDDYIGKTR